MAGQPGELHFASRKTNKQLSEKNSVPWHKIEPVIQNAFGDILLIFDCCYAGNLGVNFDGRGHHWATRSFELLAACKHNAKTHPPGPKSFTKALIWALTSLLDERGKFSTHELQMKIPHAKGFPREQDVRIIDRGELPSDRRLVLAAVPLPSDPTTPESVLSRPTAPRPKKFIDLRFWYTDGLGEDEIVELSTQLKQLIRSEHIKADRVGWIRLGTVDLVKNVIEKWKGFRQRRATTTLLRLAIPPSPLQNNLHASYTPPPSQSGKSSISDAHIETGDIFATSINAPEINGSTGDHPIPKETEVKNPGNHVAERVFSSDRDLRARSLTGAIPSSIGTSDLVLALSCFFACSCLCSYIFNGK